MDLKWYVVWGALSIYVLDARRNRRIEAFLKNPRKNWRVAVFDVLVFCGLAYSFVGNLFEIKSTREAFLLGATWEAAVLSLLGQSVVVKKNRKDTRGGKPQTFENGHIPDAAPTPLNLPPTSETNPIGTSTRTKSVKSGRVQKAQKGGSNV